MIEAQSLRFNLTDPVSSDRQTTRGFQIAIDDEAVWPMAGMADALLEIQIDDLLAFLAEHWKPLLLRQTYPGALNPHQPSKLRAHATKRWDEVPAEVVEREEDAVLAFEDSHDLSSAFAGLFDLPSFWIFRSGEQYLIETQERLWTLPYDVGVGALNDLGNCISEILGAVGDKWKPLLNEWDRRAEGDGVRLLAWATGIDTKESGLLISEGILTEPASFADAANDNDELRIAARMAGALPIQQIREILLIARAYPSADAPDLERLASECTEELKSERWIGKKRFVQGEVAARFVRNWLGYGLDTAIDLASVFERLSINLRAADVEPETLDGLAIWGPSHGPGVFLNLASLRVSGVETNEPNDDPALRVTLAHELCHLLLDGHHAVSAVDVLKSRMPVGLEQRAKSFAGEFLLPSRTAAYQWEAMGRPHAREGIRNVLVELEHQFRIPRAVSTWKLDHGLQFWGVDLSVILDSLSRYRR
jgi:hypothetical protein